MDRASRLSKHVYFMNRNIDRILLFCFTIDGNNNNNNNNNDLDGLKLRVTTVNENPLTS